VPTAIVGPVSLVYTHFTARLPSKDTGGSGQAALQGAHCSREPRGHDVMPPRPAHALMLACSDEPRGHGERTMQAPSCQAIVGALDMNTNVKKAGACRADGDVGRRGRGAVVGGARAGGRRGRVRGLQAARAGRRGARRRRGRGRRARVLRQRPVLPLPPPARAPVRQARHQAFTRGPSCITGVKCTKRRALFVL